MLAPIQRAMASEPTSGTLAALDPDRMKSVTALFLLATLASIAGCSTDEESALPPVEVAKSSLARDRAPVVSDADRATFAKDNAAFAIDIYNAVRKDAKADDAVFLSPHSISTALAMTYAGARGDT